MNQDEGIAILCDARGIVESVVRDELGLAERVPPGASIVELADAANAEKAGRFLRELQKMRAAFDWVITVPCADGLAPLHFTGGIADGGFLVVAARSRNGLARVNEELMRINSEQTNAVRATAKELAMRFRETSENDSRMYDELMRVNNDLSNAQRELFKKNIELAALNEEKNQFLGMAAHDLRSPLGVILNYSQFLEDEAGAALSAEHREFLTIMRETSEFMLSLINDMLDVSQFESGKLKMDLHSSDLTEVVRHNVALNRVLAEKKQIRVSFEAADKLPPMMIDRGKMEQVLNNLLSNALKFSYAGSEVSVRLKRENEFALITIADQGQGIPRRICRNSSSRSAARA
jgi:signal transduction histidine kinase